MKEIDFVKKVIEFSPKKIIWVYPPQRVIVIDRNNIERKYAFKFDSKQFSFLYDKIIEEIKTRAFQGDRVEKWECFDYRGNYSEKIKQNILKMRSGSVEKRLKKFNKRSVLELTRKYNIPNYMVSLFLIELNLTTDFNDQCYLDAKSMGLV